MKGKGSIGIGLMGLGVVGGRVAKALQEKGESLTGQVGCPLVLRRVLEVPPDPPNFEFVSEEAFPRK